MFTNENTSLTRNDSNCQQQQKKAKFTKFFQKIQQVIKLT